MRMMLTRILLLIFCLISLIEADIYYQCDFEKECNDYVFDSYWIVENNSSHIDHTYGNLSGHYITYTNTSVSEPLTIYHIRDWVDLPSNFSACLSQWIYSGPGGTYFTVELAQGDDLQARLPVGVFGMDMPDPQWRGLEIVLPDANHFIPYVIFTNITSSVDLDDLSVVSCSSPEPIAPIITILDCDFDQNSCSELISLSNYSYTWSKIQAEEAQNYTPIAPAVDYSIGDGTGHYIWLNNSDSLQSGGAGYFSTPVIRLTVADPAYCLSFHYYRFGFDFQTSKLTVLALGEGNAKSVAQVWPINPINYTYINNRWSWAYTPLPLGNYSLLFRMDSNYEIDSSFAVDSISIRSCKYLQLYFSGTSHLEFACDFDSNIDSTCGIRDDSTDINPQSLIYYTIRSPNNINDRDLGPRQSSGWSGDSFLYWSRSSSTLSTLINGQFKTPLIETNRDMCLRFSYFVNSTDAQPNENNTKIHILARGCHIDILWSIELDNSFGWQLVTQPLHHTACTQAIYFHITQERPTRVAVAFDDITIAQCGTLHVLTTTAPSSTTTPSNKSSLNYINSILLITVLLLCFGLTVSIH